MPLGPIMGVARGRTRQKQDGRIGQILMLGHGGLFKSGEGQQGAVKLGKELAKIGQLRLRGPQKKV